jgi:hypothetical protein
MKHKCINCGDLLRADENHEKRFDPYAEEIHNKQINFGYWCNHCYKQACEDI